ncbi:MAG: hypothetical protein QGI78_04235 [Phycisphaerales bacterium]|jgi:RNA polymerase primary sigma factor|nr:hypothetical protein [Phycisphaerales bacterium]
MPIAPRFQIKQLQEFGEQICRAPDHVRVKQMDACEQLASEISQDHLYPLDYVVFRITGYRVESEYQLNLLGDPLRSDLVTLVAVISRTLNLKRGGMLALEEIAQLYGVSNRTVQRLRKEGLVFHWTVDASAKKKLGCRKETAAQFFKHHKKRIQTASAFSQLTTNEQKLLINAAQQYKGKGLTLNALAKELARTNHRGLETIRTLLKNNEGTQHTYVQTAPLSMTDAKIVRRAKRRGVSWKLLQRRFGRTPEAMRKAIIRLKVAELKEDNISFIELPSFQREDAAEIILGVSSVKSLSPPHLEISAEKNVDQRDDDGQELALVSAMHLLKFRASHAIALLPYAPPARIIDRIETDLRWAFQIQQQLMLQTLPAGLAVCTQHVGMPLADLPLQQSTTFVKNTIALIWSVLSTIDPTKGQKLQSLSISHIDRVLSQEGIPPRRGRASARRSTTTLPFPSNELISWSRLLPQKTPEEVAEESKAYYALKFGWVGFPRTVMEIAREAQCSEIKVVRGLQKW